MLKKLAVFTLCLLMMTPAFAVFYAGGSIGVLTNTSKNGAYRGIVPLFLAGYNEMITPEFYAAAELFGTPSTFNLSNDTGAADSLRSTRMIGASFIPGYIITENVLGFLRLGLTNTLFTGPNTSRTGFNLGVGLGTALTDYWHLRFEYDYTAYSSQHLIGAAKSDQFSAALIYHFL